MKQYDVAVGWQGYVEPRKGGLPRGQEGGIAGPASESNSDSPSAGQSRGARLSPEVRARGKSSPERKKALGTD